MRLEPCQPPSPSQLAKVKRVLFPDSDSEGEGARGSLAEGSKAKGSKQSAAQAEAEAVGTSSKKTITNINKGTTKKNIGIKASIKQSHEKGKAIIAGQSVDKMKAGKKTKAKGALTLKMGNNGSVPTLGSSKDEAGKKGAKVKKLGVKPKGQLKAETTRQIEAGPVEPETASGALSESTGNENAAGPQPDGPPIKLPPKVGSQPDPVASSTPQPSVEPKPVTGSQPVPAPNPQPVPAPNPKPATAPDSQSAPAAASQSSTESAVNSPVKTQSFHVPESRDSADSIASSASHPGNESTPDAKEVPSSSQGAPKPCPNGVMIAPKKGKRKLFSARTLADPPEKVPSPVAKRKPGPQDINSILMAKDKEKPLNPKPPVKKRPLSAKQRAEVYRINHADKIKKQIENESEDIKKLVEARKERLKRRQVENDDESDN